MKSTIECRVNSLVLDGFICVSEDFDSLLKILEMTGRSQELLLRNPLAAKRS